MSTSFEDMKDMFFRDHLQAYNNSRTPAAPPAPPPPKAALPDIGPIKQNHPTDYSSQLSEDNALPWQRYLGADISKDLPQEMINRGANPDYYVNATNRNMGSDYKLPGTDAISGGSPLLGAINKRYQQRFDTAMDSQKATQKNDASKYQADQIGSANKLMTAVEQNRMQNFKEQWDFQMQRYNQYREWERSQNEARSKTIGTILGYLGPIGLPIAVAGKATGTF